jgi:hypothetical protein
MSLDGSATCQSSNARPAKSRSPGIPDMLTINCGCESDASCMLFENWPLIRMPRWSRTNSACSAIAPVGETPALAGAITSGASERASASAIWLWQEFPAHTKRTLSGLGTADRLAHPRAELKRIGVRIYDLTTEQDGHTARDERIIIFTPQNGHISSAAGMICESFSARVESFRARIRLTTASAPPSGAPMRIAQPRVAISRSTGIAQNATPSSAQTSKPSHRYGRRVLIVRCGSFPHTEHSHRLQNPSGNSGIQKICPTSNDRKYAERRGWSHLRQ